MASCCPSDEDAPAPAAPTGTVAKSKLDSVTKALLRKSATEDCGGMAGMRWGRADGRGRDCGCWRRRWITITTARATKTRAAPASPTPSPTAAEEEELDGTVSRFMGGAGDAGGVVVAAIRVEEEGAEVGAEVEIEPPVDRVPTKVVLEPPVERVPTKVVLEPPVERVPTKVVLEGVAPELSVVAEAGEVDPK
jgi:hypothetical protein